jgi:hypothetical protein
VVSRGGRCKGSGVHCVPLAVSGVVACVLGACGSFCCVLLMCVNAIVLSLNLLMFEGASWLSRHCAVPATWLPPLPATQNCL